MLRIIFANLIKGAYLSLNKMRGTLYPNLRLFLREKRGGGGKGGANEKREKIPEKIPFFLNQINDGLSMQ